MALLQAQIGIAVLSLTATSDAGGSRVGSSREPEGRGAYREAAP